MELVEGGVLRPLGTVPVGGWGGDGRRALDEARLKAALPQLQLPRGHPLCSIGAPRDRWGTAHLAGNGDAAFVTRVGLVNGCSELGRLFDREIGGDGISQAPSLDGGQGVAAQFARQHRLLVHDPWV